MTLKALGYSPHTTPLKRRYLCKRPTCSWSVAAPVIDKAVEELCLDALRPDAIALGLALTEEVERQQSELDRQWSLRLERARYEARLAERRYKAVDPALSRSDPGVHM
jgi:hypothetical protein